MKKDLDTKETLLQTALELIWANSYEAVTVDEICAKADVRKGSFYHYFSSKAELAIAALDASWTELQRELDHIFSPQRTPLQRLKGYLKFSYDVQLEQQKKLGYAVGCPYTSLGCEQCAGESGLRERANEILERVKKYFVQAVRDGVQDGTFAFKNYEQKADELFVYDLGAHAQSRVANSLEPFKRIEAAWTSLLGLDKEALKKAA